MISGLSFYQGPENEQYTIGLATGVSGVRDQSCFTVQAFGFVSGELGSCSCLLSLL